MDGELYKIPLNHFENIFLSPISCTDSVILNRYCCKKCLGTIVSFKYELVLNQSINKEVAQGQMFPHTFTAGGASWVFGIFPSGLNESLNHVFLAVYCKYKPRYLSKVGANCLFSFDGKTNKFFKKNFFLDNVGYGCAKGILESDIKVIRGHFLLMFSSQDVCSTQNCSHANLISFENTESIENDVVFTKPYDILLKGDDWVYYFYSDYFKSSNLPSLIELSKNSEFLDAYTTININNISAYAMKSILTFLHSGKLKLGFESVVEVSKFANMYSLISLKLVCEFVLIFLHLNESTFLECLLIAYSSDLRIIVNQCLTLLAANFASAIKSDFWPKLLKNPKAALNITKYLGETTRLFRKKNVNILSAVSIKNKDKIKYLENGRNIILQAYTSLNDQLSGLIVLVKIQIDLNNWNKSYQYSFQIDETKWSLIILCELIDNEEYISCYLCFTSSANNQSKIIADVIFDSKEGIVYNEQFLKNEDKGISKWKLKKNCENDFIVNFALRIKKKGYQIQRSDDSTTDYLICQQFNDLSKLYFLKPQDLLLVGMDWELKVHKAVLSTHSPVFNAMFSHDTEENTDSTLKMDDISSEAVKEILVFMYTGRLELTKMTALDICIAADKYLIDSLKIACEHVLSNMLTYENVSECYTAACTYNLPILKSDCIEMIIKQFSSVTKTEGWNQLMTQSLLTEDLLNILFKSEVKFL